MPIAITARIAGIHGMLIVSISNSLNIQATANINKITASVGNFVFAILPPFIKLLISVILNYFIKEL